MIFAANTTARKLQLHHELNNIQQRNMSITSYTLKIKQLCDSLASISVNVEDDEMVQICLGDLAPRFDAMRTVVLARENPSSFFDLQSIIDQLKKIMFKQGATPLKAMCCTHTRMEKEDACEELHAEACRHNRLNRIAIEIERWFNGKLKGIHRVRGRDKRESKTHKVTQN